MRLYERGSREICEIHYQATTDDIENCLLQNSDLESV
jgi:hypothetical protein